MDKRIIAPLIAVSVISLLIGVGISNILQKDNVPREELIKLQQELDHLKSELAMFYPPLPEEIYNVSGTVTEVGDRFLVMEAQVRVSQFPLPEGKEFERQNIKVNVTDETEIFQLEIVELLLPEEPGEELPEPFKKVILGFEDIEIGEYITVTSGENIKGKTEVTASQIELFY